MALAALGASRAAAGHGIRLQASDIVTRRGSVVVSISTELARVTQVAVLVHGTAYPLAAVLRPDGAEQPWQLTVELDRTRRITTLLQAEGAWYSVSREVKVAAQAW
jgi:predicted secreted protein